MKALVHFYDEKVTFTLPPTLPVFKNLVSHYYVLSEAEVNQLNFFFINSKKNLLSSEEEYQKVLARPKYYPTKIVVELKEKDESIRTQDNVLMEKLEKVKNALVDKKEKVQEILNIQGQKVKDMWNNHGAKAIEMVQYPKEMVNDIWNNEGGKIMDMWNNIKIKDKMDLAKGKCIEVYHNLQNNIPFLKQETIEKPKEVVLEKPKEVVPEKPKEVVHRNIICDQCNKYPITGIRFKCTICNDFDFCEECEKKYGESHNHPFLKIRKPEYAPIEIRCNVNHRYNYCKKN